MWLPCLARSFLLSLFPHTSPHKHNPYTHTSESAVYPSDQTNSLNQFVTLSTSEIPHTTTHAIINSPRNRNQFTSFCTSFTGCFSLVYIYINTSHSQCNSASSGISLLPFSTCPVNKTESATYKYPVSLPPIGTIQPHTTTSRNFSSSCVVHHLITTRLFPSLSNIFTMHC